MSDAADKHLDRQPRPLVSGGGRLLDVANVFAHAAQAQQAAAAGQVVEHLVERLTRLLDNPRKDERIEVADAVVVQQARLRTHAQAVRHALAVFDGTKRV